MWESLKEHKYLYGGLVIGALILWYVLGNSNSGASATYDPAGNVNAGNDLAGAQLQAQTQIAGIQAQAGAQHDAIQGSLDYANISAAAAHDANTIAAEVAEQQINATLQGHSLDSTLSANVAINGQNQQTSQLAIATNGQVQTTSLITNALVQQSANQSSAFVASQQIAADAACHGFGCLF